MKKSWARLRVNDAVCPPFNHRRTRGGNPTCRFFPIVKNYILDTNVLLHDPNSLVNFDEHNVLLPIEVIEEIDRFKRESTELGRNARTVSRMLDGFRGEGSLSEGVELPNGGKLKIAFQKNGHGDTVLSKDSVDNRILALAAACRRRSRKTRRFWCPRTSTCASRPTRWD